MPRQTVGSLRVCKKISVHHLLKLMRGLGPSQLLGHHLASPSHLLHIGGHGRLISVFETFRLVVFWRVFVEMPSLSVRMMSEESLGRFQSVVSVEDAKEEEYAIKNEDSRAVIRAVARRRCEDDRWLLVRRKEAGTDWMEF